MRHRRKGTRLNRKPNQLKALLRSLVTSLVLNGKMVTTQAKAKAIIPVFDRLVVSTRKKDSMNAIRTAQKILFGETAQRKFIQEILPQFEGRASGFLSLLKIGSRDGDNAPVVQISFSYDKPTLPKEEVKAEESALVETKAEVKEEKKLKTTETKAKKAPAKKKAAAKKDAPKEEKK